MIDSYDKLTIGKYRELIAIDKGDEDDTSYGIQILAILADVDEDELMDMPLDEFTSLMAKTKFLYKEVQKLDYKHLGKTMTINGKKYRIVKDAKDMTAGQYIDYKNYITNENFFDTLPYILTVFIVPDGCKYGNGYDTAELAKELNDNLDIRTALFISDFFLNQSRTSINVSLHYLKWKMKRMMRKETNKEMKTKIADCLEQIESLRTLINSSDGFIQQ